MGNQKVQEKGFPRPGAAKNDGMRGVLIVKVEKIGCTVIGFEGRKVFGVQMLVPAFSRVQGEQEGVVGIIDVRQPQIAKVEVPIPRHGGKERIQQVVAFLEQQTVVHGKYLV